MFSTQKVEHIFKKESEGLPNVPDESHTIQMNHMHFGEEWTARVLEGECRVC